MRICQKRSEYDYRVWPKLLRNSSCLYTSEYSTRYTILQVTWVNISTSICMTRESLRKFLIPKCNQSRKWFEVIDEIFEVHGTDDAVKKFSHLLEKLSTDHCTVGNTGDYVNWRLCSRFRVFSVKTKLIWVLGESKEREPINRFLRMTCLAICKTVHYLTNFMRPSQEKSLRILTIKLWLGILKQINVSSREWQRKRIVGIISNLMIKSGENQYLQTLSIYGVVVRFQHLIIVWIFYFQNFTPRYFLCVWLEICTRIKLNMKYIFQL